jgi:hypothetical protein
MHTAGCYGSNGMRVTHRKNERRLGPVLEPRNHAKDNRFLNRNTASIPPLMYLILKGKISLNPGTNQKSLWRRIDSKRIHGAGGSSAPKEIAKRPNEVLYGTPNRPEAVIYCAPSGSRKPGFRPV